MHLSLTVLSAGKYQGKTIRVSSPHFSIGRGPECHLRVANKLISRRHCEIALRDGKLWVVDFDSANGTLVNGRRVHGATELWDADRLEVGPLQMTVRVEGAPAGAGEPAAEDFELADPLPAQAEGGSAPPSGGSTLLELSALPITKPAQTPRGRRKTELLTLAKRPGGVDEVVAVYRRHFPTPGTERCPAVAVMVARILSKEFPGG